MDDEESNSWVNEKSIQNNGFHKKNKYDKMSKVGVNFSKLFCVLRKYFLKLNKFNCHKTKEQKISCTSSAR